MIYCDECGWVPEKEENLPVLLPTDVEFTGKGRVSAYNKQGLSQRQLVQSVVKKQLEKWILWIHSLILLGTSYDTQMQRMNKKHSARTNKNTG